MSIKLIFSLCIFLGTFFPEKNHIKPACAETREFIYTLRYTDQFKQAIKWTTKENQTAREHVEYIKSLVEEDKGYMLGRTTNIYDLEFFGIVVFNASGMDEAKKIMENDPLIKNEIMKGEVKPFSIIFLKEKKN